MPKRCGLANEPATSQRRFFAAFFLVARFFVARFLAAFFFVARFLVTRFLAAFFFVAAFLVAAFLVARFFVARFTVAFFLATFFLREKGNVGESLWLAKLAFRKPPATAHQLQIV